jgi:hypothetical protein
MVLAGIMRRAWEQEALLMKRALFGIFLALLLFSDGGAAAQNGCPFGAFCGLSVSWGTTLANTRTGAPAEPQEFRIYVGRDGRVFRGRANYPGLGSICTRDGATTKITCQNGKCSDGSARNPKIEEQAERTCTANMQSQTLVIHLSIRSRATNNDNPGNDYLIEIDDTDHIDIQGDHCIVRTDVASRRGQADAARPLTHWRGKSSSCTIAHKNVFAQ